MKEIDYYPEITSFIEAQLNSNFRAAGIDNLKIYWCIGELTSNLNRLVQTDPVFCSCFSGYARQTPPLSLDIFGVITNGIHFEIIILEIKRMNAVGLQQWSQLVGYTIVSNSLYGILINVDGGVSSRLQRILSDDSNVSCIKRILTNNQVIETVLGCMNWNSTTKNFEYTNLGIINSISKLSKLLITKFSK